MIPMGVPGLAWKFKREISILALSLFAWAIFQENKTLKATLAAKPAVESHTEKNTITKTVAGPVRIVEKFVSVAGKCEPVMIERVTESEPVVIEKIVEVTKDRLVTPACLAVKTHGDYQFLVGASANPTRAQDGQLIHVGLGLQNILDLSYGHSLPGQPERHDIRFMTRWGR